MDAQQAAKHDMRAAQLSEVFKALKPLLEKHRGNMEVAHDEKGNFYLYSHHILSSGKPLFFGAVIMRQYYVSYHLMPVYLQPYLLKGVSRTLTQKMYGKSCFKFRKINDKLFAQLDGLTQRSYKYYTNEGFVPS